MQIQPQVALNTGFKLWLDEVTTGAQIAQGVPLDGFASSLRRTGLVVQYLTTVRTSGTVGGKDPTQSTGDLRKMGLVDGTNAAATLTPLGDAVLDGWNALGVANDVPEFEIARSGILITEALRMGIPRYVHAYEFWCRLVALQPADYWMNLDRWGLYAPSYLNTTTSNGYNAFDALVGATGGDLPDVPEWTAWADSDPVVEIELKKLIDRVTSQRTVGRLPFCRAMELYRLARTTPYLVPSTLIGWNVANV